MIQKESGNREPARGTQKEYQNENRKQKTENRKREKSQQPVFIPEVIKTMPESNILKQLMRAPRSVFGIVRRQFELTSPDISRRWRWWRRKGMKNCIEPMFLFFVIRPLCCFSLNYKICLIGSNCMRKICNCVLYSKCIIMVRALLHCRAHIHRLLFGRKSRDQYRAYRHIHFSSQL